MSSTVSLRAAAIAVLGLTMMTGNAQSADLVSIPSTPQRRDLGAHLFEAACLACHYEGAGKKSFGRRSPLAAESPDELAEFILYGKAPEDDEGAMPGFKGALTDADITSLIIWLRTTSKPDAPWADVAAHVADMRASGSRQD